MSEQALIFLLGLLLGGLGGVIGVVVLVCLLLDDEDGSS